MKKRRADINIRHDVSLLTEHDIYPFRQGNDYRLYDKLGSHPTTMNGTGGGLRGLGPNAERVAVMGDSNGWNRDSHPLRPRADSSGIWEGFMPGLGAGELYLRLGTQPPYALSLLRARCSVRSQARFKRTAHVPGDRRAVSRRGGCGAGAGAPSGTALVRVARLAR
jgi:1,4-alpha-glucan branching enzyme